MPTNVTPQYREAEARYRAAKTPQDKLDALEEMLRIVPKHKGTEKLQADIKARIAKVRKDPGRKAGAQGRSHHIPREGAGQVALIGPPNSGKSSLVAALTHAHPRIGDYPFTTQEPVTGMMAFEDVAIQLIDLPPVSPEHTDPRVYDLARQCDVVWIVTGHQNSLEEHARSLQLLSERKTRVFPAGTTAPGLEHAGEVLKPGLLVVTHADEGESAENLAVLRELLEASWPVFPVSARTETGRDALRKRTFETLDVIRVYTKEPGKDPDRERPFTLPQGATVYALAQAIHRDVADHVRFARVWGEAVFDGEQVRADHELADGNIVELHLR